ncbi:MAG: carboxymuconolactone decarboxylase family protein [Dehalococcoidia bacterium]|nr:carboxymuconolactone decarboxylase family protein [Dehalococcoidia bacterium]
MSRLTTLEMDELTPEQKQVADAIVSGPRGGLRGPFNAWLRSPGLADPAQRLGAYCRFDNVLPRDLSEMAIILTGRHWKAQYEFYAHARMAREAGLAEEIVEAIRIGTPPPLTRDEERAVYDFVTEYLRDHRVSDANYQRVIDLWGERGAVDLVGVVGYYGLVSMTLNVFEVPLPEGVEPPLP